MRYCLAQQIGFQTNRRFEENRLIAMVVVGQIHFEEPVLDGGQRQGSGDIALIGFHHRAGANHCGQAGDGLMFEQELGLNFQAGLAGRGC